MPTLDLRIGIDVGGTNTDAVALDLDNRILAKAKVPTSADVTQGVHEALNRVISDPAVDVARITHVMLSTTHVTNAILELRRLQKVAVLRIGSPSTISVPPLFGWPADLVSEIEGGTRIVDGGLEFDGREVCPLDHAGIRDFFTSLVDKVEAVAITSVYSPVSASHESIAADIAQDVFGERVPISLSHEVGTLGLLDRENATILNAAVTRTANEVADALSQSLADHNISAELFFAQNDGTLMSLANAVRVPVLTVGSGPASSIRGAAFLTGLSDGLVMDVGGTSTDVGMLVGGFPRVSSAPFELGGVRTSFRMPDLFVMALGGGTIIRSHDRQVALGPDSVGYLLTERGLVFGGTTATLTDAAVHAGRADIGSRRPPNARQHEFTEALRLADELLNDAVDQMKTARGDIPLVVVGGGSILVPDSLNGISVVLRPEHFDVANAVGAAIAEVSGSCDKVIVLSQGRQAGIDAACEEAKARAIQAGADPDRIVIVEIEEIPLTYMPTPAASIRVKAVGPLTGGRPQ